MFEDDIASERDGALIVGTRKSELRSDTKLGIQEIARQKVCRWFEISKELDARRAQHGKEARKEGNSARRL